jgi:hypothetical protein
MNVYLSQLNANPEFQINLPLTQIASLRERSTQADWFA